MKPLAKAPLRRVYYVCINTIMERNGLYYTDHRFVRLLRGLVPIFPEVILLGVGAVVVFQPTELAPDFPNLEVRVLPAHSGRFRRAFHQVLCLWPMLRNADLVCIDMPTEVGFLAALICKLRRKPFLLQILGDWKHVVLSSQRLTLARRLKGAAGEWMVRLMVRNSALVFAQGEELYKKYSRENPEAMKSNCVRSTISQDVSYQRPAGRFHDPIRLLSVSHLLSVKGLDILLKAVRQLLNAGLSVEWWCAGDGPSRQPLEDLALELGLSDRVKFWGYVPHGPDLFRLYKEADIFVLPSLSEGLPNALLEAMAHSLPVVASAVGGVPGAVRDGVQGILVEPGQPDLLADAISKLAGDPGRVDLMRSAAFRKAQQFSAESLAERSRQLIVQTFGEIG
jgi:glycosyltransferase involved in cell wall biosynthesis